MGGAAAGEAGVTTGPRGLEDEVRELTAALYEALTRGDAEWFEGVFATDPGTVHVGFADSYWIPGASFHEYLRCLFGEVAMSWEPGEAAVVVWSDAAVVVDRPTITFDDGSQLACRTTIVYRRERACGAEAGGDGGRWRIVHTHLSEGS